ncbi:hypothetical protein M422DRAFT_246062 [Sphaerobolus stellatus SS14]|nr:hypothetical protein M422DRAFT_246062 [Sphaerobolus stellatus SS14]
MKGGPFSKLQAVIDFSSRKVTRLESLGFKGSSGPIHKYGRKDKKYNWSIHELRGVPIYKYGRKDKKHHRTVHGLRESPSEPGTWKPVKTIHVYPNGKGTIMKPYGPLKGNRVGFN